MRNRTLAVCAVLILAPAAAHAHVSIQPRESAPSATVSYTVRVPTEGAVTTTGVELEIPDGITVVSVDGPADAYELKKAGERIVAITWKTDIAPKQFKTFTFVAKNPPNAAEIAWNAHQYFADGTSYDWVEPAGSKRPAARTKVAVAADKAGMPAEHKH